MVMTRAILLTTTRTSKPIISALPFGTNHAKKTPEQGAKDRPVSKNSSLIDQKIEGDYLLAW
jgi:hypothetical protein